MKNIYLGIPLIRSCAECNNVQADLSKHCADLLSADDCQAIDDGDNVDAIYFFKKAFDKFLHKRLPLKLLLYGLKGNVYQ